MSPATRFLSLPLLLIVQSPAPQPLSFLTNAASSCPAPWQLQHHSFEHRDPPTPSSAPLSTFYYDLELQHPESSAGAQPDTGHSPPGQLSGPSSVEAQQCSARDYAISVGTFPPVAAGDASALQVTEDRRRCSSGEDQQQHSEMVITFM
uniref:Uncharacterized protein n=1 Tax=Nothobranchius furzeri TaxID=105023 RepID=A0A1A7ZXU1_NOTFU